MNRTETPPLTKILYVVGAALILLGIGLTVRFAIASGERENLKSVYTETMATVDNVDSVREGRHYRKVVTGHYTVDDKDYDIVFEDYPATVQEGNKIAVYYDPNDPGKIIHNPGRGTSFAANFIALLIIAAGIAAIFFGGRMRRNVVDVQIESRYRSYDEYGGATTERAGTLFDRPIDPADLQLDKPQRPTGYRNFHQRRADRLNAMFSPQETDYTKKYAALLRDRPDNSNINTGDVSPSVENYIHEYTQGGNPAAAAEYERQHGSGFDFYKSPEQQSGGSFDFYRGPDEQSDPNNNYPM